MRAGATAALLMPPVLDVTFEELPARCPQEVFPEEVWPGKRKGHDVLKLVTEPERTARLIIGRPGPEAAAHVLVKRSEEHTSELQSHLNIVCRLLLEKKND